MAGIESNTSRSVPAQIGLVLQTRGGSNRRGGSDGWRDVSPLRYTLHRDRLVYRRAGRSHPRWLFWKPRVLPPLLGSELVSGSDVFGYDFRRKFPHNSSHGSLSTRATALPRALTSDLAMSLSFHSSRSQETPSPE